MVKFLVLYFGWPIIGMLVASVAYRDREASSCLEGLAAIYLWPLLLLRLLVK